MTDRAELKAGDRCEECLGQGLDNKLRHFYINLEEQILKCEARTCLWPHNDEVSSDEEDFMRMEDHLRLEDQNEKVEQVEKVMEIPSSPAAPAVKDDDDEFIMKLLEDLAATDDKSFSESVEDYNLEDLLPPIPDHLLNFVTASPTKTSSQQFEAKLLPNLVPASPTKTSSQQIEAKPFSTPPRKENDAKPFGTPPRKEIDTNPFRTPPRKASILPQQTPPTAQPLNIIIDLPKLDEVATNSDSNLLPASPSAQPVNFTISLPEISRANLNFLNAVKCDKGPTKVRERRKHLPSAASLSTATVRQMLRKLEKPPQNAEQQQK
ncbi:uncharacterized protein Dwil_GK27894 [Drosophila willistoni]|uniref:Uncharacterized protein n=1 Tax=Drosophila willistoni TaxID=7260 RepID=A0A0Q9WSQ6_DROWI|nr:uncharacterized protein LOC26529896 [Drosophila willistoni]KRF99164.1 uncharacterized protein Dwil_GK27894 [Drosophila willistoni]